jgi:hypothetical protein
VNPQAVISAIPWLRRIWNMTPAKLRVPLLLVVAVVGIVQFIKGRKAQTPAHVEGATADPRSPSGTDAIAGR